MSIETLQAAIQQRDKLEELRLENWAYWSRVNALPNLEPANWYDIWSKYIQDSIISKAIAEQDAQNIEDVIVDLNLMAVHNDDPNPTGAKKWGHVWFTVLKIRYLDPDRPIEAMAREAKHRLKRPMAERTFQHHVQTAKKNVFICANSI